MNFQNSTQMIFLNVLNMTARVETPRTSECFLNEPTPSHPSQESPEKHPSLESPEEHHLAAAASSPDH